MKRSFVPVGRGGPSRAAKIQARQPFRAIPYQTARPGLVCNFCQKPGHSQQYCRMANGWCLVCGARDHAVETCPHRRVGFATQTLPAPQGQHVQRTLPGPVGQRQQGPVMRRALPLPPQHVARPVQRGARPAAGRGRGQAYNLTAEEAGASEEVITGNIRVHSIPAVSYTHLTLPTIYSV